MATTLNFSLNTETGKYECTYTGDSGALQVRMSEEGGKLYVFGNAGIGYDMLENGVQKTQQFISYLDMTGLTSVKLVCTVPVTKAIINN